jgi:hypothetical protein
VNWRHTRGLEVLCRDATDLAALGEVDYLIGNHFLHHLRHGEIERLFRDALAMPLRRFVFMDLMRSYVAFYAHSVFAALLCPGTFVGEDGRRSIRRGFTASETASLLSGIGLQDRVHVYTMAPARIVIVGDGDCCAHCRDEPTDV